jgi:polyisoprenyl-phosphate glycosyltransferase
VTKFTEPTITGGKKMLPMLSIILPVYNERENLEALLARLVPVLEKSSNGLFEVLFVDDGSYDGSAEFLDSFHTRDCRLKVIHLSRNFGHQAAQQAGLEAAVGEAIILMDADLQDPPEILDQLVEKWRQGYDVVYAVRKKRKEGLHKRMAYAVFYRTLKAISQIDMPLDAGDFCLLERRVVDTLVSLPEHNRFLRGLRSWVGFKQVGIEYERDVRHAGSPKYTLRKLVQLALSGYIGFSAMPLHLAAWLGLLSAGTGFVLFLWVITTKLWGIPTPSGWASILALILFMGGVQFLILGVIGEYLSRVYDEVRQRPLYIVGSCVGFNSRERPQFESVPYRPTYFMTMRNSQEILGNREASVR